MGGHKPVQIIRRTEGRKQNEYPRGGTNAQDAYSEVAKGKRDGKASTREVCGTPEPMQITRTEQRRQKYHTKYHARVPHVREHNKRERCYCGP